MDKEFSNKEKNRHGNSFQFSIISSLDTYQEKGNLKYIKNYRKGKKGYKDKKQFLAKIKIEFNNGKSWLIYTTTSFRSDRFKGNEWDAFNLKEIDESISQIYMVYPDNLPEEEQLKFINRNHSIDDNKVFSSFNKIIPQWEFLKMLEDEIFQEYSDGKKSDSLGKSFEQRIISILNNKDNLRKWKKNEKFIEGFSYDKFALILNILNVKDIDEIKASKYNKPLPNGGHPKTDILVEITKLDGEIETKTISVKQSKASTVSVHQSSADIFVNVLDRNNNQLKELLIDYQKAGGIRRFGQAGENNIEKLTNELSPYVDKLELWALSGEGGLINDKNQIAQYIITYSKKYEDFNMYPIKDYIKMLKENNKIRHFGTIFSWTSHSSSSGSKSKSIQLKLPILHNL